MGLHGGGVGVARFFAKHGADVLATDLKNKEELLPSLEKLKSYKNISYVLGQHRLKDFREADLVIKGSSVSFESQYLTEAQKNGVPIETDIGIFLKLCMAPIIGVTGTKGKSTTATLIYLFLKKKYDDVVLAGNIRASVLDKVEEIKKETRVVLELSSWQLAGIDRDKFSPHIAVITNILEDHMNYYKSTGDYIKDKKVIFKYQKEGDFLVLNYDNETTRSFAKEAVSQVCFYGFSKMKNSSFSQGAFIENETIFNLKGEKICNTEEVSLKGKHNLSNILAAATVSSILGVLPSDMRGVLKNFTGIAYRLEKIAEINGVLFYNDTSATTPDAAVAALETFEKGKTVLIAGGAEKNLSFEEMAKEISQRVKALVLLEGAATQRLHDLVDKELEKEGKTVEIYTATSMEKAVNIAFEYAGRGEVVLLSPGCASFGMFKHEFDRGDQFNFFVGKLKEKEYGAK